MNTILLGNLIKIRWIAIFGQLSTIIFVSLILKINIPFFEAFLIILLSIAINLYSYLIEKQSKTISNIQAFLFGDLHLTFHLHNNLLLRKLEPYLYLRQEVYKQVGLKFFRSGPTKLYLLQTVLLSPNQKKLGGEKWRDFLRSLVWS